MIGHDRLGSVTSWVDHKQKVAAKSPRVPCCLVDAAFFRFPHLLRFGTGPRDRQTASLIGIVNMFSLPTPSLVGTKNIGLLGVFCFLLSCAFFLACDIKPSLAYNIGSVIRPPCGKHHRVSMGRSGEQGFTRTNHASLGGINSSVSPEPPSTHPAPDPFSDDKATGIKTSQTNLIRAGCRQKVETFQLRKATVKSSGNSEFAASEPGPGW